MKSPTISGRWEENRDYHFASVRERAASSALPIQRLHIGSMPLRRCIWSCPRPLFHEACGRIAPKRSCWQSIDPISGGGWIAYGPPLDHADYDVRLGPAWWQSAAMEGLLHG